VNASVLPAFSDGKPVSTFLENAPGVTLRPYEEADEAATISLWQRTWQLAYPQLDFAARVDWWRERWRKELVPAADIMLAELDGVLAGFVTVDASGYLDQIVVAPEAWGSNVAVALIDAAKRMSPTRLDLLVNQDNARAIRFYEKHGFAVAGIDTNPRSGAPLYRMSWRRG
jgi:putative acetyltransferase